MYIAVAENFSQPHWLELLRAKSTTVQIKRWGEETCHRCPIRIEQ